jgi:phage terminase small subunit
MTDLDDLLGIEEAPKSRLSLTANQEAWCQEYIRTSNGVGSYVTAYGSTRPKSKLGSDVKYLKSLPKVQARLTELRDELSREMVISKAQVLNELVKIAMFDVRNLYDAKGELVPLHELDDVTAASITGLEANRLRTPTTEDPEATTLITAKVKLADKRAALVDIGKALGMFTDKVEMTGAEGKDLIPEVSSPHDLARRVAFLLTSGMKA